MSAGGRKNGRLAAIAALAGGETVAKAAAKAGVSERTIFRWQQDEDFRRQVAAACAEMFGRALGSMADGAVSAALTMRHLGLKARSETVRLGAARTILELGVKLRDSLDMEQRRAALEQRLAAEGRSAGPRG
jgi:hypothetical protein